MALVPLGWLFRASRNADRAARVLKLARAGRHVQLLPALLATAACACAGLAAAQPALRVQHKGSTRAASEILYVVDVSRSMAASAAPGGTSRLARARAVVARLRADTADVPSGLGRNDRPCAPVSPADTDRAVFAATLRQSVAIESPPPREVNITATTFDALGSIAGSGWFDGSAKRRTCVVVTDGESRTFSPADVADALNAARCSLDRRACRWNRRSRLRRRGARSRIRARPGGRGKGCSARPERPASSQPAVPLPPPGASPPGRAGPLVRTTPREIVHPLAPWLALLTLVLAVMLAWIRIESLAPPAA